MSGWLDTPNLNVLQKGLDATSLRQRVLANNIANVDTPDFKRSDVDFAAVLGSVMKDPNELPLKTSSAKHFSSGSSAGSGQAVVEDDSTILRNDGNNVDIEQEMTNLAENSLQYNAIARALTAQLTNLNIAIDAK